MVTYSFSFLGVSRKLFSCTRYRSTHCSSSGKIRPNLKSEPNDYFLFEQRTLKYRYMQYILGDVVAPLNLRTVAKVVVLWLTKPSQVRSELRII